jgi:hypothetical protein
MMILLGSSALLPGSLRFLLAAALLVIPTFLPAHLSPKRHGTSLKIAYARNNTKNGSSKFRQEAENLV